MTQQIFLDLSLYWLFFWKGLEASRQFFVMFTSSRIFWKVWKVYKAAETWPSELVVYQSAKRTVCCVQRSLKWIFTCVILKWIEIYCFVVNLTEAGYSSGYWSELILWILRLIRIGQLCTVSPQEWKTVKGLSSTAQWLLNLWILVRSG